MSILKKNLNDFISFLQNITIKEEENIETFIKNKLNEFSIRKKNPILVFFY